MLDVFKKIGSGIGNFFKGAVNTAKSAISLVFQTGKELTGKIIDIQKQAITTVGELGKFVSQTVGGAVHDYQEVLVQ